MIRYNSVFAPEFLDFMEFDGGPNVEKLQRYVAKLSSDRDREALNEFKKNCSQIISDVGQAGYYADQDHKPVYKQMFEALEELARRNHKYIK